MQRRGFLRTLIAGAIAVWAGMLPGRVESTAVLAFRHGVASGDPLEDGVILWTRISGAGGRPRRVRWIIASDPELRSVHAQGETSTDADVDYTVKVDARGLPPGRTLYYGFDVDGLRSPVGRTRTLPRGAIDSASFAVVSCSNFPAGFFNVYRDIAGRNDLDAVIHLGDYLYEYGLGDYATENAEQLGRVPEPTGETLTLAEYRQRHAQYKRDPDSLAMLQQHPLIPVWDDHELANDAWRGGAQNHDDPEGGWPARRDAAIRAWFEWMPVRGTPDGADTRTFRHFRYGDLLTLIMLDTRLYGRDRQPDSGTDLTHEDVVAALEDPSRRLLGERQERWFRDRLRESAGTTWQVVGQQVMLAPVLAPDLGPLLDVERPAMMSREQLDQVIAQSEGNPPMLFDTWNGYPAARYDFLADLGELAANPVVLTGDLHTSMANEVTRTGESRPVTLEIMTPAVTSPGFAEYLPENRPGAFRDGTLDVNPCIRYMETDRRGWVYLNLTRVECVAEWHLVDTVLSRDYESYIDRRLSAVAGDVSAGFRDV